MAAASNIESFAAALASPLDFQSLFDAIPVVLLVLDDAHNVHYANTLAEHILGVSAAGMIGKPLGNVMELDDNWQTILASHRQYGQGMKVADQHIQPLRGAPAMRAHVHLSGAVATPTGENHCVLMLETLAVSGKLDSQVHQQKAMQSAALMSHILAHEVRNPLSGIKGAAQFLRNDVGDESQEMLDLICHEVDRIGALMGQVEFFSDSRPVSMEPVNIHEVLHHVKKLAQSGVAADVVLVESYDPSLPPVRGNRDLLVQALLNLVKNAAEELGQTDKPTIHLKTSYRSGYRKPQADGSMLSLPICIMVEDNGPGIAPDMAEQIFNPFVTSKSGGKGLGLAVVAKAVADHGGVILLEESKPGKTVFAIQLAAAQQIQE